ncbi:S46 family peptidase, partial [Gemmatimonadota bacterium]
AGIHESILLLGGGTGEFVSADGLIMTNHHVAFGAVARIATAENDYITDGYLAETRADEIQALGYTARMVQYYEDVTDRVLTRVEDGMTWEARQQTINTAVRDIVNEARERDDSLEFSISTVSYGKGGDVHDPDIPDRLETDQLERVAVGNFGSETDNWMFPRHTGDFSFLRAYVASDGSGAAFNPENVPYHPRTWLKVARDAPAEDDFVFLLGFPGTTMRYRDSAYVSYERESRLPYEIMIRGERIVVMERAGEGDRELQIRFAETIKGIANGFKNYQGKVIGIDRMDLVSAKRQEEQAWVDWYSSDPRLRSRYDGVLQELGEIYRGMLERDALNRTISELLYSPVQSYALNLFEYILQKALPENRRSSRYRGETLDRVRDSLLDGPADYYGPVDEELYLNAAVRSLALPGQDAIAPFRAISLGKEIQGYAPALERAIREAYSSSPLLHPEGRAALVDMSAEEAADRGGLFLKVAADIRERYLEADAARQFAGSRLERLEQLYAEGIMALRESQGEMLYPDANRSLRFSYGYVRGYEPKDAVSIEPFTHLKGVMEKETGEGEFIVPEILARAWQERDFGRWADPSGDVPVNFLTNCDTTGGNSGSPLMNAQGELIGINFDRVWEATANDYNFDPEFGRNISVHMHYILFICETFGAANVIAELGF